MSSTEAIFTDPYSYLGFIRNADGSLTRKPDVFPATAASSDPANPVLTKDVPINHHNSTWARLYLPATATAAPPAKLPVIVYFHGSGFVASSAASLMFQKFCSDTALEIPAVMASVEYRLAPEHRLPAAYDDGEEAVHWLKASGDEWLTDYADLSKCYIMGTSAGANIALRIGLRVEPERLAPVKIRGFILHQSFYSGVERTATEMRMADDRVIPLSLLDLLWSLCLPVGADRDHEFCNLVNFLKAEGVEKMKRQEWKVLVQGCDGDPLIDRQKELGRVLEENGVNVIQDFGEGGFHGVELVDDSRAAIFIGILKNFILGG